MSKISNIKQSIFRYKQSLNMAKNLLNMAMIQSGKYAKKLTIAKNKFLFFLDLTRYYPINFQPGESINVAIGSHMGFCGGFNNNIKKAMNSSEENYYIIGKKLHGHGEDPIIKEYSNVKILLNNGNTVETWNLKDMLPEKYEDYIDNHLDDNLWKFLVSSFLEYGKCISFYSENKYRIIAMTTAKDNALAMIEKLSLEYSKLRQQLITNEILLMNNIAKIIS